ncbi:MAG: hypothetical protein SOR75_00615 [Synergistes jonesii]|uniref:hypothetical protein n=1 Tax=Synergistes jonesii TaxID=2754 RepID=UPI002A752129|nr:hypothetical protein [Synergistes jonesii]MDY2983817.1 hypothetical protein [Synergistes jonesii]
MKKFFLLCLVAAACALLPSAGCCDDEGTGVSLSVFTMNLKIAAKRVKYPLSDERVEKEILHFDGGSYAIDYNESIQLFFNTAPDTKMIKNAAVSYAVERRGPRVHSFGAAGPDEDEEFASLCQQLIMSFEPQTSAKEAQKLLEQLGINGPALDGRQRQLRHGDLAYIMKLQGGNTLLLVVSGV